jgi:putative phosphoribosyl transferase
MAKDFQIFRGSQLKTGFFGRSERKIKVYASREDAGERLAEFLKNEGWRADIVLGLPRGGVIVAAEVAHRLGLPLDVVIVRKIGHPLHREYAVGAMAEGGVVVMDPRSAIRNPILKSQLDHVISEEQERLHQYEARFHQQPAAPLADKAVLLIDDGLATGATTEAAVEAVRRQRARRITVAAPVASLSAVERLQSCADEVKVLILDPEFVAVGRYYADFPQTTDEEVLHALQRRSG